MQVVNCKTMELIWLTIFYEIKAWLELKHA